MNSENSLHVDVDVFQEDINFFWNQIREFNKYSGPISIDNYLIA